MKRRSRRRSGGRRRGTTLVELLTAITVLTVGLLGLAASSGYLVHGVDGASMDAQAALSAQSKVEELAGTACASLPVGQITTFQSRGITHRMRVMDAGNNTRAILDTATWNVRDLSRRSVIATLLPCRPGA
jgi:Tfp pilus assembly protein PilV